VLSQIKPQAPHLVVPFRHESFTTPQLGSLPPSSSLALLPHPPLRSSLPRPRSRSSPWPRAAPLGFSVRPSPLILPRQAQLEGERRTIRAEERHIAALLAEHAALLAASPAPAPASSPSLLPASARAFASQPTRDPTTAAATAAVVAAGRAARTAPVPSSAPGVGGDACRTPPAAPATASVALAMAVVDAGDGAAAHTTTPSLAEPLPPCASPPGDTVVGLLARAEVGVVSFAASTTQLAATEGRPAGSEPTASIGDRSASPSALRAAVVVSPGPSALRARTPVSPTASPPGVSLPRQPPPTRQPPAPPPRPSLHLTVPPTAPPRVLEVPPEDDRDAPSPPPRAEPRAAPPPPPPPPTPTSWSPPPLAASPLPKALLPATGTVNSASLKPPPPRVAASPPPEPELPKPTVTPPLPRDAPVLPATSLSISQLERTVGHASAAHQLHSQEILDRDSTGDDAGKPGEEDVQPAAGCTDIAASAAATPSEDRSGDEGSCSANDDENGDRDDGEGSGSDGGNAGGSGGGNSGSAACREKHAAEPTSDASLAPAVVHISLAPAVQLAAVAPPSALATDTSPSAPSPPPAVSPRAAFVYERRHAAASTLPGCTPSPTRGLTLAMLPAPAAPAAPTEPPLPLPCARVAAATASSGNAAGSESALEAPAIHAAEEPLPVSVSSPPQPAHLISPDRHSPLAPLACHAAPELAPAVDSVSTLARATTDATARQLAVNPPPPPPREPSASLSDGSASRRAESPAAIPAAVKATPPAAGASTTQQQPARAMRPAVRQTGGRESAHLSAKCERLQSEVCERRTVSALLVPRRRATPGCPRAGLVGGCSGVATGRAGGIRVRSWG